MSELAEAIVAARRGAFADVVRELLAAWRALRAPELADVLAAASELAASDRPPVSGRSQRDLHAAWMQLAAGRDALDIDRMLAALAHGNLNQAIERIAWLVSWEPDPRVAAGLEALIASPPSAAFVKGSSAVLWKNVCLVLEHVGDPRTRTIHERLAWLADDRAPSPFDVGTRRGTVTKAVARVAAAIPPARPLDAEASARVTELAAILARVPRPVRGDDLLARIYEQPHDDAARAVYADWLTTNGDPRGEFIALQLARASDPLALPPLRWHRDPEPPAHERTLLTTHGKVWLGRLATLLGHADFERGFPARGYLARGATVRALAALPEAATLVDLDVRRDDHVDGRLLARPPFHGLVSVRGLTWQAFAELAGEPFTVRAVAIDDDDPLPRDPAFLDVERCLEQLAIEGGSQDDPRPADADVLAFMRTRIVRALRALAIGYHARNDRAFVRGMAESAIERLVLETWSHTFELEVVRDDELCTRIAIRYDAHPSNRQSTVPLLRQRAATWPRDVVDRAIVEIDARYERELRAEYEAILATAEQFAGELDVRAF